MSSETLRYLKYDYQALKESFQQRVRERWPGRWNDFLANSLGNVFLDLVAWGLATLAFLINRVAGEQYIPTMTLRESAIRIGALTGYKLRNPKPATVLCEAVLATPQTSSISIKKGTLVRASNGMPFEVAADYTIAANETSPKQLIAVISPNFSGLNVLNTFLKATQNSTILESQNNGLDLGAYIAQGQTLYPLGSTDGYRIVSVEATGDSLDGARTRLILDRAWTGASGFIEAEVYEQRILLVHGQTVEENYVAPVNTENYTIRLNQTPVIDNTVQVQVNNEFWQAIDSIGLADADHKVFEIKTYVSGFTGIIFGDGFHGARVPSDATVKVTYRIGGGTEGNIELNKINTTITGINDSLENPVPVLLTNKTSVGIGGQDAETVDEARINIPVHARTNNRAVTLEDYSILASRFSHPVFGNVAYARAAISNTHSFLEGNQVRVYAWTSGPTGGLTNLSPALKMALQEYLQAHAIITDYVTILDGTYRPIPVSLRFSVDSGYSILEVNQAMRTTLTSFVNALRPGDSVIYSDLFERLKSVPGVRSLLFATPITNLHPSTSLELFTPPDDNFIYALERRASGNPVVESDGVSASPYTVQLPVFPIQPWSVRLFFGSTELSVLPFFYPDANNQIQVQQARIIGNYLSTAPERPSVLNLLTGQMKLWIRGAPGDLTMKLNTFNGYKSERTTQLHLGYLGDTSQNKRREIRAALQTWSQGLSVGQTIYLKNVSGIPVSQVNITDMLSSFPGVEQVTQVSLVSPGSTLQYLTLADYEVLRLDKIIINNYED
jgi:hypothetical protein